jgi:hypothetical protein
MLAGNAKMPQGFSIKDTQYSYSYMIRISFSMIHILVFHVLIHLHGRYDYSSLSGSSMKWISIHRQVSYHGPEILTPHAQSP